MLLGAVIAWRWTVDPHTEEILTDKTYNFGQEQRENSKIIDIEFKELNPNKMAQHLIIKTS